MMTTMFLKTLNTSLSKIKVAQTVEYSVTRFLADALKRDRLLEDFGRNFHGYISRPGENMTSISEKKIKSEFSRTSLQR